MINILRKIQMAVLLFVVLLLGSASCVYAESLDEIQVYYIIADVNEDASVNLCYHIEWEVLDSTKEGPLSWVKIGLPNKHYTSYTPLSSTIKSMSIEGGAETYAKITFDRSYYEGEVVSFDFSVTQDYLYQMNKYQEGFTEYSFTPGWFDDIRIDDLTICWNADKVDSFSPECEVENGYLTWNTYLGKGDKYKVTVTYPNDAFNFLTLEEVEENTKEPLIETIIEYIVGFICMIAPLGFGFLMVMAVKKAAYAAGASFGNGGKKITRTIVTYFPTCQGCGATREDGQKFCAFCGRSFVEKEETITEENVPSDKKDVLNFKNKGEYRYSSNPNTYVRVNVVNIPISRSTSRSHSGGHSSCAHSSCACACACACAGGGRAGCTVKDFYNTNLKLKNVLKNCSAKQP